jgi:trimeric autotransporter adhesin
MASRYWVNGSGSWTSTTKWSTSSGGSGGASVPTSADDVTIDSNSGSPTITIPSTPVAACKSLLITLSSNCTITSSGGTIAIYGGALTGNDGAIWTGTGTVSWQPTVTELAGGDFGTWSVSFLGSFLISSNLSTTGTFVIGSPSLNTTWDSSNDILTCKSIQFEGGTISINRVRVDGTTTAANVSLNQTGTYPPVVTQTSFGNIEIIGTNPTANISLINNSSSSVNISGDPLGSARTGTLTLNMLGASSYINNFRNMTTDTTVNFSGTKYITTFSNCGGVSGNLLYFRSTVTGTQYTLSSGTTGDTRSFSFLDVKDCVAAGATTWNAFVSNGCVNSGNNVNWNFGQSNAAFMQFF